MHDAAPEGSCPNGRIQGLVPRTSLVLGTCQATGGLDGLDWVDAQRTEPPRGLASCQGLEGGPPSILAAAGQSMRHWPIITPATKQPLAGCLPNQSNGSWRWDRKKAIIVESQ